MMKVLRTGKISSAIAVLLLLAASTFVLASSRSALRTSNFFPPEDDTPLYLPQTPYVKLVTLGYDTFFSDLFWFKTVSYFGKHYKGDQDYRWLEQMCDLVTGLDPKAMHVYEFCGTLLAWVDSDADGAEKILSKGIEANPHQWRPLYLRGFTYWYFKNDKVKARDDLARAAQLEGAPPFIASLASRLMVAADSPETAAAFLQDMLKRSNDDTVRQALQDKLNRAYLARDLRFLDKASSIYEQRSGGRPNNPQDLVAAGIINKVPQEPFGGSYVFDGSGKAATTSGEKPLEFFGKTAETGLKKEMSN